MYGGAIRRAIIQTTQDAVCLHQRHIDLSRLSTTLQLAGQWKYKHVQAARHVTFNYHCAANLYSFVNKQ